MHISESLDVQRDYLCSLLSDLIIFTLWKTESLSYKVMRHPKKDDPKAIFQDFSLLCCQEKGLSKRRFQPNAAAVIALGRWADRRLERDKAPPDVLRHGGVASKEVWRRGCKNKMFDRCSCCSSKNDLYCLPFDIKTNVSPAFGHVELKHSNNLFLLNGSCWDGTNWFSK